MFAAVVVAVASWIVVGSWVDSFEASIELTNTGLETAGETIGLIEDSLGILVVAGEDLENSMAGIDDTAVDVTRLVEDTAVLLGESLPSDIEAIRRAMDGLIDTANVIDGVLGALSFVGVPYDPAVPMDEALSEVDARLGVLPDRLRQQSEMMAEVSDGVGAFADDIDGIVSSLGRLTEQADYQTTLAAYQETVAEAQASVGQAADDLGSARWWLRFVIVLMAAVAALAMSAVWWWGRQWPPRPGH